MASCFSPLVRVCCRPSYRCRLSRNDSDVTAPLGREIDPRLLSVTNRNSTKGFRILHDLWPWWPWKGQVKVTTIFLVLHSTWTVVRIAYRTGVYWQNSSPCPDWSNDRLLLQQLSHSWCWASCIFSHDRVHAISYLAYRKLQTYYCATHFVDYCNCTSSYTQAMSYSAHSLLRGMPVSRFLSTVWSCNMRYLISSPSPKFQESLARDPTIVHRLAEKIAWYSSKPCEPLILIKVKNLSV